MKLEKRDITLNEADSLTDVFFMTKNLALHYLFALEHVEGKEKRKTLLALLKEVGEDLFMASDFMRKSREEQNKVNL